MTRRRRHKFPSSIFIFLSIFLLSSEKEVVYRVYFMGNIIAINYQKCNCTVTIGFTLIHERLDSRSMNEILVWSHCSLQKLHLPTLYDFSIDKALRPSSCEFTLMNYIQSRVWKKMYPLCRHKMTGVAIVPQIPWHTISIIYVIAEKRQQKNK